MSFDKTFAGPASGIDGGDFHNDPSGFEVTTGTFTAHITQNSSGFYVGTWSYSGTWQDTMEGVSDSVELSGTIQDERGVADGLLGLVLSASNLGPFSSFIGGSASLSANGSTLQVTALSFSEYFETTVNDFTEGFTDDFDATTGVMGAAVLPPVISFSSGSLQINEGQKANYTISRDFIPVGDTGSTVHVKFSDLVTSAVANVNYFPTVTGANITSAGTNDFLVTFAPNAKSASISVQTLDDHAVPLASPEYELVLFNPTNATLGPATADTTIVNIDKTTVTGATTPGTSGTVHAGQTVTIKLNFSQHPVTVAGAPTLKLSNGGTATYDEGSSDLANGIVAFDYTAAIGQNTPDLKITSLTVPAGSSIKDASGALVSGTGAANVDLHLIVDATPPTVTKVSAPAGSYDAGKTVAITLTMSEVVNANLQGSPTLSLSDGGQASYVSGGGTNSLVFDYVVGQSDTSTSALKIINVNLGASVIVDNASNNANFAAALTTVPSIVIDTTAPVVTKVTGAPATGTLITGGTDTITLTMSEKVTVAGNPILTLDDGGKATYVSGSGGAALLFKYTVSGQEHTDPGVTLHSTGLDLNGGSIIDVAHNAIDGSGAAADLKVAVKITPVITGVTSDPAAGISIKAGDTLKISLNLNEDVTVTGAPTLTLSNGGKALYNAGESDSDTLTFDYKVGATDKSGDIKITGVTLPTGASVVDDDGDKAVFTGAINTDLHVVVDTVAPAMTSKLKNDTGASVTDKITVDATLTGTGDANVAVHFNVDGSDIAKTVMADSKGAWTITAGDLGLADGQHTVIASETDAAGNTGSASLTFKVDITAPLAANVSSSPANGAHVGTGGTAIITIDLGEAVAVTGAPTLLLSDGETATYAAGSSHLSSGFMAFSYKATTGHNTGDLTIDHVVIPTGAVVKDIAGNIAVFTGVAGADLGLVIDTNPPAVTAVAGTPGSGAVHAGQTVKIDLTTSEAATVIGAPTLTLSDGGVAVFNHGGDTTSTTLEFDYTTKAGQNSADLKVSGLALPSGASIKDVAGNTIAPALPASADLHLTVDTIAPVVTKVTALPASGALKHSDVVTITLATSEATVVIGSPALALNDGGTAVYDDTDSTATSRVFKYTVGSESTTDLKITGIDQSSGSITDLAGNALSSTLSSDLKLTANVFTWAHAAGGDWDLASNWLPAAVPQAGNTALITVVGTYTVTSSQANAVAILDTEKTATLAINGNEFDITSGTGTGASAGTIAVADNSSLGLGKTSATAAFNNTGTIALDAMGHATDLIVAGNVMLQGAGKLTLSANAHNAILSDGSAATLTNVGNTIAGAGTIGDTHLTLVNQLHGIIDASSPVSLTISTGANIDSNAGIIEATGGGHLIVESSIIQNSGTGMIEALGAGSVLELDDSTNIAASAVSIGKGATLSLGQLSTGTTVVSGPVTNAGTIDVPGLGTLTFDGHFTNSGSVENSIGTLNINGDVINTGSIALGGLAGNGSIVGNVTNSSTMTNADIHGNLINSGTFKDGDITGNVTNTATMTADESTGISVSGNLVNSGTVNVLSASVVIEGTDSGAGSFKIGNIGVLTLQGAASNNVVFNAGTVGGMLVLGDSTHFTGKVSGFAELDFIQFSNVTFGAPGTSASYTPNSSQTSGVVQVTDGVHSGSVTIVGSHVGTDFKIIDSNDGLHHVDLVLV